MALPVATCFLAVWSIAMLRYGRSALYPAAIASLVWCLTFLGLLLGGDLYFPITNQTASMVVAGVLAFSVGGFAAVRVPLGGRGLMTQVAPLRRRQVRRFLKWAPAVLVLNFPLFLFSLMHLSGSIAPRESALKQVRIASVKASASGGLEIETSLLPFITILALIAIYEYADGGLSRISAGATFCIACLYELIYGDRSDLLLLMIGAVVILWLCRGKAPVRALLVGGLLFFTIFAANQVVMGKFGADPNAGLKDNLPKITNGAATYWLGGIVGFDQVRQNPKLAYGVDLNKFITRIANRLGADMDAHDRNLNYTNVSSTQITNVYTVFFAYGPRPEDKVTMLALMFSVGLVSTLIYRKAVQGGCWAIFCYGTIVFATLMMIFSEEYFAQMTFLLKTCLVSLALYFAPPLTDSRLAQVPAEVAEAA